MAKSQSHHPHQLICSKCGRAEEFGNCPLGNLIGDLENSSGYKIQDHWLRLIGLCPECKH